MDLIQVLGVRVGRVYRLQGKPVVGSKGILDHGSMSVTKVKQQKALKGEQTYSVWGRPSEGKRELAPSSSAKRPSWYEMTLMDA